MKLKTEWMLADLLAEREILAAEAQTFEPLLDDDDVSPVDLDTWIEELRAIRMRIHEIDNLVADLGPAKEPS